METSCYRFDVDVKIFVINQKSISVVYTYVGIRIHSVVLSIYHTKTQRHFNLRHFEEGLSQNVGDAEIRGTIMNQALLRWLNKKKDLHLFIIIYLEAL